MMNRALALEEKIGQLLVASLDGAELDAQAERFLAECKVGNVVHFANNVGTPEQTAAFNRSLREMISRNTGVAPLIAIDHEGGRVMRFSKGATHFPSAMAIGEVNDPALAEAVGRAMGCELRAMGFSMNFAPVLDVNCNAANPVIGVRAFGDTPQKVGMLGAAMIRGMQAEGMLACGKHFPGHGDTAVDSHFDLPLVEKPRAMLDAVELPPFREAIAAGVAAIMTTHILYPALEVRRVPATMSRAILKGLLRDEMGFEGLIITDGMQMRAISAHYSVERGCVEAVRAGADLVCVGTAGVGQEAIQRRCYDALLHAAQVGDIPMERIDDAVGRILAAKAQVPEGSLPAVDWPAHQALARLVAGRSVRCLAGGALPRGLRVLCCSRQMTAVRGGVGEGDSPARPFAEVAAAAVGGTARLLTENDGVIAEELDAYDAVLVGITALGEDTLEMRCLHAARMQGKRAVAVLMALPGEGALLPEGCDVWQIFGAELYSAMAVCKAAIGEG